MSLPNKRILAITLARGGSKGINKKNLVDINGSPLIKYTIDEAKKSKYIDRYIVSTDCPSISEYCKSVGVDVPFLRPSFLASDTATSHDALKHGVLFCEEQEGVKYDYVVELMCTNPFKSHSDIDNCIEILDSKAADSVIGVTRLIDHHPARIKKLVNGYLQDFCVPETSSRRQDLNPPAFIRNGSIYALNRDKLVMHNHRFGGNNSIGYQMPSDKSINIDTKLDLVLARTLLRPDS